MILNLGSNCFTASGVECRPSAAGPDRTELLVKLLVKPLVKRAPAPLGSGTGGRVW
jgi:hypothetical protein